VLSIDELTGAQALECQTSWPIIGAWQGRTPGIRVHSAWHLVFHHQFRCGDRSGGLAFLVDPLALSKTAPPHVRRTVEADSATKKWHFVVDNLDIHQSETLVWYVAQESDVAVDLGVRGQSGI